MPAFERTANEHARPALHEALAELYLRSNTWHIAQVHLENALKLRDKLYGADCDSEDTFKTLRLLSRVYRRLNVSSKIFDVEIRLLRARGRADGVD